VVQHYLYIPFAATDYESKDAPNINKPQSSVATIPAFFIPEKPPTPPSASSSLPKTPLKETIRGLSRSPSFYLVFIPFSIYVGFFNAISSLLNQILEPYGFTETEAGMPPTSLSPLFHLINTPRYLRRPPHCRGPRHRSPHLPHPRPHARLPPRHQSAGPHHRALLPRLRLRAPDPHARGALRHRFHPGRRILQPRTHRARVPRRGHLARVAGSRLHRLLGRRPAARRHLHRHHERAEGGERGRGGRRRRQGGGEWRLSAWKYAARAGVPGCRGVRYCAVAAGARREEVGFGRREGQGEVEA